MKSKTTTTMTKQQQQHKQQKKPKEPSANNTVFAVYYCTTNEVVFGRDCLLIAQSRFVLCNIFQQGRRGGTLAFLGQ
jgi:hypothetical protein